MVEYGAFSHKIDYVTIFKEILSLEWHRNRNTGSKVTEILLNRWIFPIAGSSAMKGLRLQPAQVACFFIAQLSISVSYLCFGNSYVSLPSLLFRFCPVDDISSSTRFRTYFVERGIRGWVGGRGRGGDRHSVKDAFPQNVNNLPFF